jgi:hypothetical protein
VGVLEVMKFCKVHSTFLPSLGALTLLMLAGCGGGSHTNVVKVTIVPHNTTVIVSQSITLTAGVTGSTDTTISSWTCQYQTTSFDSTGKSTTGTAADCKSVNGAVGSIPDNSTNTTVVYTAPSQIPDAKTIAGTNCTSASQACVLSVLIKATATADAKATDTATLSLDSGIVVSITPTTATVPTSEQQRFVATLTNDLQQKGVTWLVTQDTTQLQTYLRRYRRVGTVHGSYGRADDRDADRGGDLGGRPGTLRPGKRDDHHGWAYNFQRNLAHRRSSGRIFLRHLS